MQKRKAEKSQKILDALIQNIESFRELLKTVEEETTRQNILRSIVLFSCSGIDAIVKQLILETLEYVIERDEGAQEQLRKFTSRQLKNNSDPNYTLLAELLTSRNIRKSLINMLKKELSFGSLQSSEQLYKVAGYFNISTDALIATEKRNDLKGAFNTRNIIVHQMDVDLDQKSLKIIKHTPEEVDKYFDVIKTVASNFIRIVDEILEKEVTPDYIPMITIDDGVLTIQE